MTKLDEFASNIAGGLSDLEDGFGKLSDRVNALKKRGASIGDRWNAWLLTQEQSVAAAENAINKISNAPVPSPLPASPTPPAVSPQPTFPPPAVSPLPPPAVQEQHHQTVDSVRPRLGGN
jgi:hypothetical protein